jgi:predicted GIY-YIG superfamily endonuclease
MKPPGVGVVGQSATGTYMVVGVTEGGLTVGASADALKRCANHQSGHVEAKYKLWPHLQARILP